MYRVEAAEPRRDYVGEVRRHGEGEGQAGGEGVLAEREEREDG